MACPPRHLTLLWVILGTVAWLPASGRAWAETSYFPVPSVSTSKNDGSSAGLIVPFLITDPDGELKEIVAPMFVVNQYVGAQGTVNLFRYQPGGRVLRFIASFSQKIERKLVLNYTDPAFHHGRFALSFGGAFFKNATSRFYGIGSNTSLGALTNYTARESRAQWEFGVHLNEVTQIAIGQRFRDVEIQPGVVTSFPFSAAVFPTATGMQGATILGHRATFYYDTRDSLVSPTSGTRVMVYAELNQNFRSSQQPVYERYNLDITKLLPSESKGVILVLRGNIQATFGPAPFYEQSSLGGQFNLRGYGVDRFIDKHLISVSVENRVHVLRTRVLGVMADFEVAPFVDMGKTFNQFNTLTLRTNVRVTPGVGFRALVRPNVVGRVDYGYSPEGGAVFAGLDYPF